MLGEREVKDEVFQLDRRHRESHSMMLDVKRINAAVDLEVKRLTAEVANVGDTRFSKWGCRASGEHVMS